MERARDNGRTSLKEVAVALVLPTALLLSWDLLIRTGVFPKTLIASPTAVVRNFFTLLSENTLLVHSVVSLRRMLTGFLIGSSLGISLGVVVGYWKVGRRLVEPTVLALLPVPPIAWIPLLIILLGIGEVSKIALISMGSFFTLFVNTVHGVRSTDTRLLEVAYVLEKSDRYVLRGIVLPSAIPSMIAGARVAAALSWTLLISAEVIASAQGLGWLIWDSRNFSRPADMICGMMAVGILGKLTDSGLVLLERYFTRYRRVFHGH